MPSKSEKVDALLAEVGIRSAGERAYYEGYFACFNRQMYYEAHEVLEELWHPVRRKHDGDFYRGLIQLAGAFVHLSKGKRDPGLRLLRMAHENLGKYPSPYRDLNLGGVRELIEGWMREVETSQSTVPKEVPRLALGAGPHGKTST